MCFSSGNFSQKCLIDYLIASICSGILKYSCLICMCLYNVVLVNVNLLKLWWMNTIMQETAGMWLFINNHFIVIFFAAYQQKVRMPKLVCLITENYNACSFVLDNLEKMMANWTTSEQETHKHEAFWSTTNSQLYEICPKIHDETESCTAGCYVWEFLSSIPH